MEVTEREAATPLTKEQRTSTRGIPLRRLNIHTYDLYGAAALAFIVALRLLLVALGWPPTNSDEGTMGLMAMHIAYQGDHPYFFYGQNYMGSLEAYLGAFFFRLFGGPSLFALRLSVILLVTLFFIALYVLTSFLFSRKLAVVTLIMLSIGSIPYLTRQTIATGGSSETLLFGTLAFLLAAWLAYTYKRVLPFQAMWRVAAYGCWGLIVGLGMWSDMVVLPYFAVAGLLLLIFCWREVLTWAWIIMLICVFIGLTPLIKYDLSHHINSGAILLSLVHGSSATAPTSLRGILHNIKSTTLVSIPTATGEPFCPVYELPFLSDNVPQTPQCTVIHAAWGGGYILLMGIALLFALGGLRALRSRHYDADSDEQRRERVRYVARLLLLCGGILNIAVFVFSSGPVNWPGFHARYLIGLVIVTPALIAPLWSAASRIAAPADWSERAKRCASRAVLVIAWGIFLTGTIIAFTELPAAQNAYRQRVDLINHLLSLGERHIYTNYWTCDDIAFTSHERIICGIPNASLGYDWVHNRVPSYYPVVHADKHAAYVMPLDTHLLPEQDAVLTPAVEKKVARNPSAYRRYVFDGYVVYVPK
jgi:hypothetical protein